MGRSRCVQPTEVRVELSDGDYLIVKKRLTAGEADRMYARTIKTLKYGERPELHPEQVAGRTEVVEYLLDWSLVGLDGRPLVIRDKSPEEVGQILDQLDQDDYQEIRAAIQLHVLAMQQEREAQKNGQAGENASSTILPSPA